MKVLFLAFDFCQFCVVIQFFHPRHNGQWPPTSRDFYTRSYPLHLFSYLNSWERASIFLFECSVLDKGTTGTIFITSLVWRGPWLGIGPGTSRTRSQHYTTRLSRRRLKVLWHKTLNQYRCKMYSWHQQNLYIPVVVTDKWRKQILTQPLYNIRGLKSIGFYVGMK